MCSSVGGSVSGGGGGGDVGVGIGGGVGDVVVGIGGGVGDVVVGIGGGVGDVVVGIGGGVGDGIIGGGDVDGWDWGVGLGVGRGDYVLDQEIDKPPVDGFPVKVGTTIVTIQRRCLQIKGVISIGYHNPKVWFALEVLEDPLTAIEMRVFGLLKTLYSTSKASILWQRQLVSMGVMAALTIPQDQIS
ncbi:hypothetical protein Tco_0803332 [Tanacetum coccineum]|uniref:Uncharacterized protein n=1 Tax=Tanacetum coccineum TaxID=301880 RepID=A0ABQ5A199_9ASTR